MIADMKSVVGGLSKRDFALLGLESVAYVRPKRIEGQQRFAIHTADGNEVAVVESRIHAEATIRQNELELVNLH